MRFRLESFRCEEIMMSDENGFGDESKIAILEVWKEKQFLNSAMSATPGSNIGTKTQRLCP